MPKYNTKMHLYTKKYVDTLIHKALYCRVDVLAVNLTKDDLEEYKNKNYNETTFEDYIAQKHNYEPCKKKIKLDQKKETNILKLVLSREGETDTFKSQFKSTLNCEGLSTSSFSNCNSSSISSSSGNNDRNSTVITNATEIIATETIATETVETTQSEESTTTIPSNSLIGKIKVRDIRTMMTIAKYEKFQKMFLIHKNLTNSIKKSINAGQLVSKKNVHLSDIEKLYRKYFNKTVQDTIVIIANILNLISLSNKHHKVRMDESFKKKTEAEKLKERCDANRMHLRHKKVLESKLKINFTEIVSRFSETEFEPIFQMFFLSILTVLRVLDQPKFKKGSIFKNLVLLLWNSLKNTDFDHPKVYILFRSKEFRPDCIDLISLIEDSRDTDPEITERMGIFFVSSVNSREYFQPVIQSVTSDCNEDLSLLIDNAALQCRINSRFTDPINSSLITQRYSPSSSTISSVGVEDPTQRWIISKNPSRIYQAIPPHNEKNKQKTTITLQSTSSSQPLNTFYENFSNSLITNISSESPSRLITSKVNVVPISAGSIVSTGQPTIVFKQAIQNIRPVSTTTVSRPDSNTIFVGNKQYQLVRGPTGQMKAVVSTASSTPSLRSPSNIVIRAQPRTLVENINCFKKNCKNSATIMCSTCTSVKYCSHTCQKSDWYSSHIHNCARLKLMKRNI